MSKLKLVEKTPIVCQETIVLNVLVLKTSWVTLTPDVTLNVPDMLNVVEIK